VGLIENKYKNRWGGNKPKKGKKKKTGWPKRGKEKCFQVTFLQTTTRGWDLRRTGKRKSKTVFRWFDIGGGSGEKKKKKTRPVGGLRRVVLRQSRNFNSNPLLNSQKKTTRFKLETNPEPEEKN